MFDHSVFFKGYSEEDESAGALYVQAYCTGVYHIVSAISFFSFFASSQ